MKSKTLENLCKSLLDNLGEGIIVADFETKKFYYGNKTICSTLGYSLEGFKNLKVLDIHPQEYLPSVLEQFERQAKKITLSKNIPVKRKDGSVLYVDISTSLVKWGKKNYIMGVFRDATGRKQTETDLKNARIAAQNVLEDLQVEREKLAQDKAKDEALLASIGDGVIATDQDGKIILINQAAERMFGWQSGQLMGKLFTEAWMILDEKGNQIPETERPTTAALRGMITTTTTTTTTGLSYFYTRKNGIKFPVAVTVTPVIVEDRIVGAVDVFRDITREKEIDRAKTEFVSLASHQLKTPPTAIKLLIERILNGKVGSLTEKQKEYFNDIQSSNQRMIDITNALLSVSRIEMGTFAIEPSDKDICALVQNVLNELKFAINNKNLRLEQIFPENSIIVPIDESLFHMVMSNLIMNAVNYTQERGKIHISCKQVNKGRTLGRKIFQENSFVVSVTDNGCGIPKNQQSNIFAKFFRADNAREKHPNGTGLGLYIIKSILDNVGGSIWFTSKENKGTIFYVAIPMAGMRTKADKKNP